MKHTLDNGTLRFTVDELGAQMMSLRTADDHEYLWQGDEKYWPDRAPLLFPFIARLQDCSYLYHGKRYEMGIHGFAAQSNFTVIEETESSITLELVQNEETLRQYPFDFSLRVTYELNHNTLNIKYLIRNDSNVIMPFGIGGHPGFNVPKDEYDRWMLKFSCRCSPDRVGFTLPDVLLSGNDEPYPLRDGNTIDLKHELFNDDAIILKNMDREVTLCSDSSDRSVKVSLPDMPYLGFWHAVRTDAPYVCIEPWSSLPGRHGVVEELSCRSDLIQLKPSCTYENIWSITIR